MKLRLLFFAAFLSLASCSSDDSTDPVNENPDPTPPVEKNLKKIKEYYVNGESEQLIMVTLCANNKIDQMIGYENDDPLEIGSIYDYSYNAQGRLSDIDVHFYNGFTDSSSSFEYDEQGRLINFDNVNDGSSTHWRREYTYNNEDNVVTGDYDPGGNLPNTFYLNGDGIIYKMEYINEYYNSATEVNYEGNNILSRTLTSYGSSTVNYTYDYETEVKGEYLNLFRNSFGGLSNMVLYEVDFNFALSSPDNYRLTESKTNSTDINYYYEYSFDEEGYPVEVRELYNNGNVFKKIVIEYE
ncbi:hypothetical protein [Flavobacterium beibuense]|uniref:YD repeat-containing protein n=1 Tax=Flavobacterium beibuense TaxID=657326 RepID=A0A444W9B5_9FLAO|nr:hypothetical protein [Flavobacterium beibuense]RYJ42342.1 hypothetical protein NU09_2128 [Flavobacterium beibuense]